MDGLRVVDCGWLIAESTLQGYELEEPTDGKAGRAKAAEEIWGEW
jgi:hypothetical protein